MTAPTVGGLLLARAEDDRPGLRYEDDTWTWREVVDASRVRAGWMDALQPADPARDRPHVGVLMANRPEYVWLLGAAALSDGVLVGLNPTRRGAALARDVRHTACDVVLVEPELAPLLDGLDLGGAAGRRRHHAARGGTRWRPTWTPRCPTTRATRRTPSCSC